MGLFNRKKTFFFFKFLPSEITHQHQQQNKQQQKEIRRILYLKEIEQESTLSFETL